MDEGSKLLLLTVVAVVGLVVLIARFQVHAFVALLLVSLGLGAASGTPLAEVTQAVTTGIGGVLGSIAAIIGLGTLLGRLLAESGGAEVVAQAFLRTGGERRLDWAMMAVGLVVGLGVWFSVGLVLLIPIAMTMARRSGVSLLVPGLPMLAGLSVMHGLVPPHPGPMVAIGLLHADTGRTLLYSLIVGVPTAIVAGPLLARWVVPRVPLTEGNLAAPFCGGPTVPPRPPGLALTLITLVLPVLLMAGATALDVVLDGLYRGQQWASDHGHAWFFTLRGGLERVRPWVAFAGTPNVAMLAAVLFASCSLGLARGFTRRDLARWSEECLGPIASILLVVGAGGAFSKVLDTCGVGRAIAAWAGGLALSPLLLGWLVAALLRVAVGSATVAISTAAGIVAPLAAASPETPVELVVLAMGAGSLILSHVNDGGFWMVKEYLHLSVPQTLKTWTLLETVIALTALILILALDAVL